MTDTTKICDAIKRLPDGSILSASFDERYEIVGKTDDLKALVAENERLRDLELSSIRRQTCPECGCGI